MAVTDAYATAATYRAVISKTDTGDDSAIDDDLTAMSRYIERRLRRFFTKDASAVARVYLPAKYAADPRILWTDDIVSVSSIKIDTDNDGSFSDESALASTDYELWPLNAADGPEVEPFTMIYLPESGDEVQWRYRVEVTAIFGWNAVPTAIERAICHLTAVLRLETPRATRQVTEMGDTIETSQQAIRIIDRIADAYGRNTAVGFI